MKRKIAIVSLVLLLTCAFTLSAARVPTAVVGRVLAGVMMDGTPVGDPTLLSNIDVYLKNEDTGRVYFRKVNRMTGMFQFLNVKPGNYVLKGYDLTYNANHVEYSFDLDFKEPIRFQVSEGDLCILDSHQIYMIKGDTTYTTGRSGYFSVQIQIETMPETNELIDDFLYRYTAEKWQNLKITRIKAPVEIKTN